MKNIKLWIEGKIDLVFGAIIAIMFLFLLFGGQMSVSGLLVPGSKENLIGFLWIFNVFLFLKHFKNQAKYEISSFIILMIVNYSAFVNQGFFENIIDTANLYWQIGLGVLLLIMIWDISTQGKD